MKLCEFTEAFGAKDTIYINPMNVVSICKYQDGAMIYTNGHHDGSALSYYVNNTPEDAWILLNHAMDR